MMAQRRAPFALWAALGTALSSGCSDPAQGPSYGDPTTLSVPSDANGIRAWVASPSIPTGLADAFPEIVVAAYTIDGAEPLEVELSKLDRDARGTRVLVGTVSASASGSGEAQRFSAQLPLVHGENRLVARIRSLSSSKVRTLDFSLYYAGEAPGATLGWALPISGTTDGSCAYDDELSPALAHAAAACLHGQITSRAGSTPSARIVSPAALAGPITLDADGRFSTRVALSPDSVQRVELFLGDSAGRSGNVSTQLIEDSTPPALTITSTADATLDPSYLLTGTATDTYGIADVRVETSAKGRESLGGVSPFALELTLSPGDNPIAVVARDRAGNETRSQLSLERVRRLFLGAPTTDVGTTKIEIDRQALTELLTPQDRADISLVSVDLRDAVRETLGRIRSPEVYGVDTSEWGAPERNLQRILEMTPDVADLSGTSVEELLNIANAVGLPAPRLLADVLALGVTDSILDLDITADVIVDQLVGSHPNIDHDADGKPVITVSLADVLDDLAPLAARFGPSGAHPGFLSGTTSSQVLEPGFLITFPVHSNLVQFDAVDLSRAGKDYLFVLAGARVLDFNILTDAFNVVGLRDEPSIDLRFVMQEAPSFVRAGNSQSAAPDAADPGFFRGNGAAFALAPWTFEHIAAEAGYRQLHRNFASSNFVRTLRYDAGSITDAAVMAWNRGFLSVTTAGNLGSPPAPLYVWDLLTETAQVRLHDNGIAEGAANLAFRLDDLPIGLSADELVEKLRPELHAQEDKLSEQLVGKTGLANSGADIFYVPAGAGAGLGMGMGLGKLVFRAAADAGGNYTYPTLGFFDDPALTNKVSTQLPLAGFGDATREQVDATVGRTYYAADSDGSRHALTILGTESGGIDVHVTHLDAEVQP